ncbi:putative GTP-binding protein engB [Besnoitia besnoiti]|uniref:Putative GTP-binding protein engB n=1 Tax=Besnoitia besnoiti TaxID=94643 RepID=A0A2A9MMY5_BESBE|nr:putative GTP-binding protein engB [Besnoitia besnoiti]PFH37831.1 putative GTP-binding protein engB [Besnoitia besnoiti]
MPPVLRIHFLLSGARIDLREGKAAFGMLAPLRRCLLCVLFVSCVWSCASSHFPCLPAPTASACLSAPALSSPPRPGRRLSPFPLLCSSFPSSSSPSSSPCSSSSPSSLAPSRLSLPTPPALTRRLGKGGASSGFSVSGSFSPFSLSALPLAPSQAAVRSHLRLQDSSPFFPPLFVCCPVLFLASQRASWRSCVSAFSDFPSCQSAPCGGCPSPARALLSSCFSRFSSEASTFPRAASSAPRPSFSALSVASRAAPVSVSSRVSPSLLSSSVFLSCSSSALQSSSSRLSPTHSIAGLASPVRERSIWKRKKASSGASRKIKKNKKKLKKINPHLPAPPHPAAPSSALQSPASPSVPPSSTPSFLSHLPSPWLRAALPASAASARALPREAFGALPLPLGLPIDAALSVLRGSACIRLPAGLRPSLVRGVRFLGSFGLAAPSAPSPPPSAEQGEDGDREESAVAPAEGAETRTGAARRARGQRGCGSDLIASGDSRRERAAAARARREQCEGTEGDEELAAGVQIVDVSEANACGKKEEDEQDEEGEEDEAEEEAEDARPDEDEGVVEGDQSLWDGGGCEARANRAAAPSCSSSDGGKARGRDGGGRRGPGRPAEAADDSGVSSPSASASFTRLSLRSRLLRELMLPSLNLPEVAFLGRSNAGKSSLLNALCSYAQRRRAGAADRARVSRRPGSTRSINLFEVFGGGGGPPGPTKTARKRRSWGEKGGTGGAAAAAASGRRRGLLVFADLPGYGHAEGLRVQETKLLSRNVRLYVEKRNELRLFLLLVDGRRGLGDFDADLLRWLVAQDIPARLVVTKADALTAAHLDNLLTQLSFYPKLLGLPPILKRLKATRGEPEAVKSHHYVSPAVLASARSSAAAEEERDDETANEAGQKPPSAAPASERHREEGTPARERGDAQGTSEAALQSQALADSGDVARGEKHEGAFRSTSSASDKRVGVLHGMEDEEGTRIRRQEDEARKALAQRVLPAIEGFRVRKRAAQTEEGSEEGLIKVVFTSSTTGQGIAELWTHICEACSAPLGPSRGEREEGKEEDDDGDDEESEGETTQETQETKEERREEERKKQRKKEAKYEPFWGFGL